MFSAVLKARMDQDKETQKAAIANRSTKGSPPTRRLGRQTRHGRKRIHDLSSDEDDAGPAKRMKTDVGKANHHETQDEDSPMFPQPALVTGAKLKNYQLEGLQWMVSLDQNGISGILGEKIVSLVLMVSCTYTTSSQLTKWDSER
jgi:ATP-dependent DNA helicase